MAAASTPGDPNLLGATWDGTATNLAVISSAGFYSGNVVACRLGEDHTEQQFTLFATPDGVWCGRIPALRPGDRYAFRSSGPHDPARGLYFDPTVLLSDPYAKAFTPALDGGARNRNSVVVDDTYDWAGDIPPRTPTVDSVFYETHVRGLTIQRPDIPVAVRGTFAGLASPPMLTYLKKLGVTTIELMPVHEFLSEQNLLDRGLKNFWGYSTLGYFAPHSGYSSAGTRGEQVIEFRDMVKTAHTAGLEIVIDVVFNHTAEGAADGPSLSWRGLANDVYYRLDPNDPSRYVDTTGTGNSLATGQPEVLRMILDSLRYWVTEMHVDGFRFDLAAELARQHGFVDRTSAFFDLLYQDPVLGRVKLVAEPWDVGAPDSYQVGRFPPRWSEWNDRFRDDIRDYWRGSADIGSLATRLAGSSDVYQGTRRGPDASTNFVTCHDGKTLADLVSYRGKHNQANQMGDSAPDAFDRSDNHGVEGPSADPVIIAARLRDSRNLLLTVLTAQGVPLLLGGDERRRTQNGNNNAYCQDNAISWYDWTASVESDALTAFTSLAVATRKAHPALSRSNFLTGTTAPGSPLADVQWFGADGNQPRWNDPQQRFLCALLDGRSTGSTSPDGTPTLDDDVLVIINGGTGTVPFTLPGRSSAVYTVLITTDSDDGRPAAGTTAVGSPLAVPGRTMLIATSPIPH